MKNYRPILLQNIELELPGLFVHRLRLNQHTPEAQWSDHSHETGQLLIYIGGRGQQKVDGRIYEARPGTIIYVAAGQVHAFQRQQSRQPLCLVIDVELGPTRGVCGECSQLPTAELTKIRNELSKLFAIRGAEQKEMMLKVGAIILEIMDPVLRAVGWLQPFNRFADKRMLTTTRIVRRAIETHDGPDLSLKGLAEKIGQPQDTLNRTLKHECGLTLGQLRARIRLGKAQELLQKRVPIQEVAESVGILDNNYFSRWFKMHTGMTPSKWRKNPKILENF